MEEYQTPEQYDSADIQSKEYENALLLPKKNYIRGQIDRLVRNEPDIEMAMRFITSNS
jgi:hypothetical protein